MATWRWWCAACVLGSSLALAPVIPARGAEDEERPEAAGQADPPPKAARSRVVAVTVYQGNALVTREVDVPAGRGIAELVVTPLPPQTIDSSLFSEGTDGLRVLSTRYRTRAVKEDTRKEVRAREEQIRQLKREANRIQKDIQVLEQNLQFLTKLENFTGATMQQLTEKGLLNSEATLSLAKYVMSARAEKTEAMVKLQLELEGNAEAATFANRELAELTAGSSRTERDAVIVVDRPDAAAAGKVRLNYLVDAATWRPQYRFHAGKEKQPVQLEYLAAVEQKTGEDWTGVDMTLSTAQPQLNATPPELLALDISVVARGGMAGLPNQSAAPQGAQRQPGAPAGGMGGGMAGMGGAMGLGINRSQVLAQSRELREKAKKELITNNAKVGGVYMNAAAALEQTDELLARKDEAKDAKGDAAAAAPAPEAATPTREGPSVTYHLRSRLTVPSRNDQQLIEVARLELKPEYYYKAVPVLTTNVYRLADLVNRSDYVLLPGEATMYAGADFVGRMELPLVAVGERFTVGFGVDPQLQVARTLVKKSRSVQGGNQVHSYDYRITVSSYKSEAVEMQVWDRLPRAEAEAVAVSLVEPSPGLSKDKGYQRREKPENLLRWDLTVEPGANGEKALTIAYQFKLEYSRDVAIANFRSQQ